MSTTTTPTPTPTDEHVCNSVTEEQLEELERKRQAYVYAKTHGTADYQAARDAFYDYATKTLMLNIKGRTDTPDKPTSPEPEKPTQGFTKPGGWGGNNDDPNSWTVTVMRDDPGKFKIIDIDGKNIATDFTSVEQAQIYITYQKWVKDNKPTEPGSGEQPTTPTTEGDKDKFGITKIFKDGPSGKFLTDFKIEFKIRNYRSGKPSEPTMEYTNAAGSPNKSADGIKNQEVTFYQRITKFKKQDDTISVKILGGAHSSDGGGKTGTCYDNQINVFGGNSKTLEIERPHPSMHPAHQKTNFSIGQSLVNKWIGVKMITYLINGNKDRHLEMLLDFPVDSIETPPNKWRKYWQVDDTGQLKEGHIIEPIGSLTTVRIDGVEKNGVEFKYASVREIEPPVK